MRSIIPGDTAGRCYICGRMEKMEVHHCLHGIRRKAADKYGLTVHLCRKCHTELHDHGRYDRELEKVAQIVFEDKYGHEEYMRVFGKDYT